MFRFYEKLNNYIVPDSEGPNRKKKRRSQSSKNRQRSLSPLSKRMAMLGENDSASRTHNSQFNHPYGYQPPPPPVEEIVAAPRSQADVDYELKVPTSKKLHH